MAKITAVVRRKLIGALQERYREVTRVERLRIVDELVTLSGYHRKYAITVLNGPGETKIEYLSARLERRETPLLDWLGTGTTGRSVGSWGALPTLSTLYSSRT